QTSYDRADVQLLATALLVHRQRKTIGTHWFDGLVHLAVTGREPCGESLHLLSRQRDKFSDLDAWIVSVLRTRPGQFQLGVEPVARRRPEKALQFAFFADVKLSAIENQWRIADRRHREVTNAELGRFIRSIVEQGLENDPHAIAFRFFGELFWSEIDSDNTGTSRGNGRDTLRAIALAAGRAAEAHPRILLVQCAH